MTDLSSNRMGNPYEPTEGHASIDNRVVNRHWLAPLPCLLPILSVSLVFLVVVLERDFGMRGAIMNDFSTTLGSLFTTSAYFLMGSLFWGPAGLFASIVLASVNSSGRYCLWHPLAYIACCIAAVLIVIADPGGMFNYYFD